MMVMMTMLVLPLAQPPRHIQAVGNRIIGAGVEQALRRQLRILGADHPRQRIERRKL